MSSSAALAEDAEILQLLAGSATPRFARELREHPGDPVRLHRLMKKGLPSKVIFRLAKVAELRQSDLAKFADISDRQLNRLKADLDKRLSSDISWRAWRAARVLAHAQEVLGSLELAVKWLHEPAKGLDGQPPLELLSSGPGADAVEDFLGRLDHGVYT